MTSPTLFAHPRRPKVWSAENTPRTPTIQNEKKRMNNTDTPNSGYLVAHAATATATNNTMGSTGVCTHQVLASVSERSSSFTSLNSSGVFSPSSSFSSFSSPERVESLLDSQLTMRPSSRCKFHDYKVSSKEKETPRRGREKAPITPSLASSRKGEERNKDRPRRRSKSPIDSLRQFASGLARGRSARQDEGINKNDTVVLPDVAPRSPASSSQEVSTNADAGRRCRSKSPIDALRRMTNGLTFCRRSNSAKSLNIEISHDGDDRSNNDEDTSTCPVGADEDDDADAVVMALLNTLNDEVFRLGHDMANWDRKVEGHLNMAMARREDGATAIGVVLSMRKLHVARQSRLRAAADQAKLIAIRGTVDEALMTSGTKVLDIPSLRNQVHRILNDTTPLDSTKVPNDQELLHELDNLMAKEKRRTTKER
mmetsp:Transcript_10776/g.20757  ORF Transcript_10776/g.20757 Transcript_10776/m.20757 type:complete len:426 (+) Transcript_10776:2-1279(+)